MRKLALALAALALLFTPAAQAQQVAPSPNVYMSGIPYGLTGNSTLIETTSAGLLTPSILPLASAAAFGAAKCDNSTITCSGGVFTAVTGGSNAFSALTSSTNNTATMQVGAGATLEPTSTSPGAVIANQVPSALGTGAVCSTSGILSAPTACPIVPTVIATSTVPLVAANAGQLVLATNGSPTTLTLAQSTGALGTGFGIDAFTEPSTSTLNVTTSKVNNLSSIKLGAYQDIAIAADGAGNYVGSLSVPQPATQTHSTVLADDMLWQAFATTGANTIVETDSGGHIANSLITGLPNANLATQTANTLLGALTATTPSGIAVPSCTDSAGNHLNWTSGTGFSCGTTSSGGTSTTLNQITSGTSNTLSSITTAFTTEVWLSASTGAKTENVPGCVSGINKDYLIENDGQNTAGTYPITVTPASGTIGPNATANYSIASNGNAVVFQCDSASTTWRVVASSVPGSSVRSNSTTSLTIGANDNGNLISQNNAGAVAATIAAANTTGFPEGGYQVIIQNIGAGAITITPTTSTINGNATFVIPGGTSASPTGGIVFADLAGNYVGLLTGAGGSGSGTVNSGTATQLAYYATSTAAVSSNAHLLETGSEHVINYATGGHAALAAQTGSLLQLVAPDATAGREEIDTYGASAFFTGVCSLGTIASPTQLTSATQCGGYNGYMRNDVGIVGPLYSFRGGAAETQVSAGTHGGSYAEIATTPIGSQTMAPIVRFENDGGITVPAAVTGGDKGAGTINAAGLFVNGVAVGTSTGNVTASGMTANNIPYATSSTGTFQLRNR